MYQYSTMFKIDLLAKLNFKTLAKIILSFGIFFLVALRLDIGSLLEQVRHLDGFMWGTALSFMVMQVFALAFRWQYLVNSGSHKIDYIDSLQITLARLLANFIFIASISGVFVRIGLTAQHGFSVVKTVCAAVIDRLLTLAALVILAALILPFLSRYVDIDAGGLYEMMVIGLSVFIVLAFIFSPLFFRHVLKDRILANRKYASSLNYIRSLGSKPSLMAKILAVSLLGQLFYFVAVYFLAIATDAHPNILALLTILPAMTLVASLPISFGGWGVREGAFVYGLGLLGVPMETAFLISIQIGIMSMLTVMVVGLPAIASSDMSRIRYQAAHAAKNCARLFDRS